MVPGLPARGLAQTLGRPSRGGAELHGEPHLLHEGDDKIHDGGFARARSACNDEHAALGGGQYGFALLPVQADGGLPLQSQKLLLEVHGDGGGGMRVQF